MPAYRVLLFATLRDLAKQEALTLTLAPNATVGQLREALAAIPALQPYAESAVIAVNHAFTTDDTPLTPDDEIAAFPPVSGG